MFHSENWFHFLKLRIYLNIINWKKKFKLIAVWKIIFTRTAFIYCFQKGLSLFILINSFWGFINFTFWLFFVILSCDWVKKAGIIKKKLINHSSIKKFIFIRTRVLFAYQLIYKLKTNILQLLKKYNDV